MRANSLLLLFVTGALLSACGTGQQRSKQSAHRYGYRGMEEETSQTVQETTPPAPTEQTTTQQTPPTKSDVTPPPPPSEKTPANPATVEKKDYPYGKAVQGKAGFVTSPYAPYSGYVDVRGFPPGTEVKDPYTGKIFLVPVP